MRSFYLDGLLAFLLCLGLTWLVRAVAVRLHWLDHPQPPHKTHPTAVPRLGGVAVLLASVAAIALLRFWQFRFDRPNFLQHTQLHLILLPTALIFLTGLLDDLYPLRWWVKLAIETMAAAGAAYLGLRIHLLLFANGHYLPPVLSYALTIAWLLACANSMNLIDGLDGLASGIALLATLTLMIAGVVTGNLALVMLTLPLAGSLLAFLIFNFNPATIFLGDSGSLTIGFLLGIFGIIWSQKATTMLALTVPVFALALPLMDSGMAIVRRLLMGASVFERDRGHLHHRLQHLGISPRRVVFLLYALSALFALVSLSLLPRYYAGLGPVVLAISALIWFGIQTLGYEGVQQTGSQLHQRMTLRRATAELVQLQHLTKRLSEQANREDLWLQLCGMAAFVGAVRCQIGWRAPTGEFSRDCWLQAPSPILWELRIPLAAGDAEGSLLLSYASQPALTGVAAASVAELLARHLSPALEALGAAPAMVKSVRAGA